MTATTVGLVYIDHRWEIKDREYYYTPSFPEDYVLVETPHIVPNGMWVSAGGYGQPVGAKREELEVLEISTKDGGRRRIFVCDKPFGLVSMDSEGRKTLDYAREVRNGELRRGVRIPPLDYVRQPDAPHRTAGRNARARRHGQYGWVKLADLGEMSRCGYRCDKEVELILGFWQFSGHRNYRYYENDQEGGQLVDVAWGSSLDIKLGTAEFKSLTQSQFREECSDTSEVWVRRGFAYTILRLQALGVQPEVTHSA